MRLSTGVASDFHLCCMQLQTITSGNYSVQFCKNTSVMTSCDLDAILADAGMQSTDHLVVCIGSGSTLEDVEIAGYDSPEVAIWVQVLCSLGSIQLSIVYGRHVMYRLQWFVTIHIQLCL